MSSPIGNLPPTNIPSSFVENVDVSSSPEVSPHNDSTQISQGSDAIDVILKGLPKPPDQLTDFKLVPRFEKQDGMNKAYPFQNGSGPWCYSFNRIYEIYYVDDTGEQKTQKFTQRIYTNVEIPGTNDRSVRNAKENMALLGASTYSRITEEVVLHEAKQDHPTYVTVREHIAKIRRDRFIKLEMYTGGDIHKINPKPTLFKRNLDKQIDKREITHIKLNIRGGEKGEKIDSGSFILDLNTLKSIHKIGTTKSGKSWREKSQTRKVALEYSDNLPSYLKQMSRIDSAAPLKQKITAANPEESIRDFFNTSKIDHQTFHATIKTENDNHAEEFERLSAYLDDSSHVSQLVRKYAPEMELSNDFLSQINPKKGKLEKVLAGGKKVVNKIRRKETSQAEPQPHFLKVLKELVSDELTNQGIRDDATHVLEAAKKAHKEMRTLDETMLEEEKLLSKMHQEFQYEYSDAPQTNRLNTLNSLVEFFPVDVRENSPEEAQDDEIALETPAPRESRDAPIEPSIVIPSSTLEGATIEEVTD